MRGSIRKHGAGWQYTVELDLDPITNRRRQQSKGGFRTKKDCEKSMNELLTQLENGLYFETKKMSLKEYLSYWLNTYAKVNVAASTFCLYVGFSNTTIKHIGNTLLNQLKPAVIQNFYSTLITEKRLSSGSILKIHRMLHLALKHAAQWEMILTNATDNVKAPRANKTEMKVWDSPTASKFLEDIKETIAYLPVMLALTTGMRQGEIAALKWSNVNFSDGFISVTHNFQRVGNQYELTKPKTEKSRRSIAMMDVTIKELKNLRIKQIEIKMGLGIKFTDDDFICSWDNGTPFRPHYISDIFRNAVSNLMYPKIRFHDLRHTHATMLLSKDVNPKIVSERLGHSTINITLDTYSHVLPNMQKEAVKKLNQLFENNI